MATTTNQTKTNQTKTTQKPAASARQCSIRCTAVPKGYALSFSYQPTRCIAIG